jgi:hypothetical protein
MTKKISANDAWKKLFEKHDILNRINKYVFFNIEASQIKEFKEPRLMAKWDSSESLPSIQKHNKINILPTSRGSYVMGKFNLYEDIPDWVDNVKEMQKVDVPEFESIDIKNITSESNAINVLMLSPILENFLDEGKNYETFTGRMGTGVFDFSVDRKSDSPLKINVNCAQCEIDAGLENDNSVIIIEAKNVVHPDFHIRQLYYPYRLWQTRVQKPIRLIFSIYTNQIYRLLEYRFTDLNNYSSIELVGEKYYTLQDINISNEDLLKVWRSTKVKTYDNQDKVDVPFIQANDFERVISLIENLQNNDLTEEQIADLMQFDIRQSDYYFNAGRYLGLFEKYNAEDYDDDTAKYYEVKKVRLTKQGKKIAEKNYKPRQLELVKLMLEHKIFHKLFWDTYTTGVLPSPHDIQNLMGKYNVCNEGQVSRRSSTVYSWLKWIFKLPEIEEI